MAEGTEIGELTSLILRFRRDRDWEQFHNPKDMAISLALEAAELLELVQWTNGEELAATLKAKKKDLAEELSDVLYWTLLIAHDQGINLVEAFKGKMANNEAKYPVAKARGSSRKYSEL